MANLSRRVLNNNVSFNRANLMSCRQEEQKHTQTVISAKYLITTFRLMKTGCLMELSTLFE